MPSPLYLGRMRLPQLRQVLNYAYGDHELCVRARLHAYALACMIPVALCVLAHVYAHACVRACVRSVCLCVFVCARVRLLLRGLLLSLSSRVQNQSESHLHRQQRRSPTQSQVTRLPRMR